MDVPRGRIDKSLPEGGNDRVKCHAIRKNSPTHIGRISNDKVRKFDFHLTELETFAIFISLSIHREM